MEKEWRKNGERMEKEWRKNGERMEKEWRKNGEGMEEDKVSYLGSFFLLIYLFISDNGSMSELINNIIIHII